MPEVENATPQEEHRFHNYVGNTVPWYIHLIWALYWIMAILYLVRWMLPAIQDEMLAPP